MPKRVLICGSRDWDNHEHIERVVADLAAVNPRTIIIQGGAPGADSAAKRAAKDNRLHCAEVSALWDNGRRAGPERNRAMLDLEPDLVIAFQQNKSPGTQNTIDEARRRGITTWVFND
jgi:hypothetical protein